MRNTLAFLILIVCIAMVSGCGQKGDLVRPEAAPAKKTGSTLPTAAPIAGSNAVVAR